MSLLGILLQSIPYPPVSPSADAIDVVIPVIRKDLFILPLCLAGVRACINHPVAAIYIVAPQDDEIKDFCEKNDLVFVDESTVLGMSPKDIGLKVQTRDGEVDRSGWLFQQLLKLSGTIGTCENYLCIDADHVLLQPHTFVSESGKTVLYTTNREHHKAYYRNIKRITSVRRICPLSFVVHKMLFNKRQIALLQSEIEKTVGKQWIDAIISSYDRQEISGFSEYELYGNFMHDRMLRPWKEKELKYESIDTYENLVSRYGKRYLSVTFPEWKNDSKR